MRRNILFASLVIGLLLLAPPAFAINYSASAWLDFSNLTFSGIGVSLNPDEQRLATSKSVLPSLGWPDQTLTTDIPGSQTEVVIADSTQGKTSISMTGGDVAFADFIRWGTVVANEAGNLTVSIPYTLMQSGIPTGDPSFSSIAEVGLNLPTSDNSASSHLIITNMSGEGSWSGVLSVTRYFSAGETHSLIVNARNDARVVPLPNMLWPTLAGMVGLGLLHERQRRRDQRVNVLSK